MWSLYLYGIDTNDANLYDIVLHIDHLNVADAVSILTDVAGLPPFKGADESKKILEDLSKNVLIFLRALAMVFRQ